MSVMRSPAGAVAVLGLQLLLCSAAAQTVVNSTFVAQPGGFYSNPNNWAPAEVPHNTEATRYNVTVPLGVGVSVDTSATISNLNLGGFAHLFRTTLTVTGTTQFVIDEGYHIAVLSSEDAPSAFNAGTLSAFSNNTLRGHYAILSGGSPATLQFRGANIGTLVNGSVHLYGVLARVIDENGNDALRNLARVESSATLGLDGSNVVTSVPFTNNGTLSLGITGGATTFTATHSLTNFDFASRTITGGKFRLGHSFAAPGSFPTEFRFNGADIVNNGSELELIGATTRITDLAGLDGLRNLARNLPGASLRLREHSFATAGNFTNDGFLSLRDTLFTVAGSLTNFDPGTRTLSGGMYEISGADFKFNGADIVRNGASIVLEYGGSITDLATNNGLRNFADNLGGASFTVGQSQSFTAGGDFANAGEIKIVYLPYGIPEQPSEPGRFTVPSGFRYTQTAGLTVNDGVLTAKSVNFLGGSLSGSGLITGDLTVTNATVAPVQGAKIDGNLTLSSGSRLHCTIDRYAVGSWREITGKAVLAGTLDIEITDELFLASNAVLIVLESTGPMTGAFSNAPNGARITTIDGSGSFVVVYESNRVTITQFQPLPPPVQLLNISTRAALTRSDDDPFGTRSVLIGGFIISGFDPKTVVLRGIGPSLANSGVGSPLADPTLRLHASPNGVVATNDNWKDSQPDEIIQIGLAPADDREAVIVATLAPGSYTVVLREKSGLAGNGLIEVYDVSKSATSKLANISTRGFTDGNDLLIGGIIAGGDGQGNTVVVARAIGPQLRRNGVLNAIEDPTLELRDHNGSLVAFNDNWGDNFDQIPGELQPGHTRESALRVSLPRGNYTAIVRPKGDLGGVALVEFYDLRR